MVDFKMASKNFETLNIEDDSESSSSCLFRIAPRVYKCAFMILHEERRKEGERGNGR